MSSSSLKKILFLGASPRDCDAIQINLESENIVATINLQKYKFIKELNVTNKNILNSIRQIKPQIVHFSGHGTDNYLITHPEQDIGQHDVLRNEIFFRIIKKTTSIKCVVLNCCYSETLANMLIKIKHINAVIGTTNKIKNQTCIKFSSGFYESLGNSHSFYEAFEDGKLNIAAQNIIGENIFKFSGNQNFSFNDEIIEEKPPKSVINASKLIYGYACFILISILLPLFGFSLNQTLPKKNVEDGIGFIFFLPFLISILSYYVSLGKNWARILITVFFIIWIITSLYQIPFIIKTINITTFFSLAILFLLCYTLILLYNKESKKWYSKRRNIKLNERVWK